MRRQPFSCKIMETLKELILALDLSDPAIMRQAVKFATDAANLIPVANFRETAEDDDRFGDLKRSAENSYRDYSASFSAARHWYGAFILNPSDGCTDIRLCLVFFISFAASTHLAFEYYASITHRLSPAKWDYSRIEQMHKDLFFKHFA